MPQTSPLTRKNEGNKNDEQQILAFLKNDRFRLNLIISSRVDRRSFTSSPPQNRT
jgi:hypothetical protein